ncbi:MAG TPA: protein-L-isoaspartate O-methyltransferase [Steroidobacteraceae bacterium]|nr:protein-L-isoaspartate O-methyltransferase [Steroidobacteraceae bacterium]
MSTTSVARTQMTYQQIRAWSVLPAEVLAVFERLPREDFVPAAWSGAAYADLAIPLGDGQHMLTPSLIGRILQAVAVRRSDRVLEIGTGSGYLTACLALLAGWVHSLEIRPGLARRARANLHVAGIGNAEVEEVDAFAWQPVRPSWDVIVLTGSLPHPDPRFEALLAPQGRLFVITGKAPAMQARLIHKDHAPREARSLFETVVDPLDYPAAAARFEF